MTVEKKDRNLDMFLMRYGLPPYDREYAFKEIEAKHGISRQKIHEKLVRYKLLYPKLYDARCRSHQKNKEIV